MLRMRKSHAFASDLKYGNIYIELLRSRGLLFNNIIIM